MLCAGNSNNLGQLKVKNAKVHILRSYCENKKLGDCNNCLGSELNPFHAETFFTFIQSPKVNFFLLKSKNLGGPKLENLESSIFFWHSKKLYHIVHLVIKVIKSAS